MDRLWKSYCEGFTLVRKKTRCLVDKSSKIIDTSRVFFEPKWSPTYCSIKGLCLHFLTTQKYHIFPDVHEQHCNKRGFPTVRKRPVKYLLRIYRKRSVFLGPLGIPRQNTRKHESTDSIGNRKGRTCFCLDSEICSYVCGNRCIW